MEKDNLTDPVLFREYIKAKHADMVWNAYLHQNKIEQLLNQDLAGSLNSLVQLFLQYVLKEWACPNCLQTILPFMKNCYRELPENGDIAYVSSPILLSHFPVLLCPHCETNIVVIATSEHSDIFEFRYKNIKGEVFDFVEERALSNREIKELGLTRKGQQSLINYKLRKF